MGKTFRRNDRWKRDHRDKNFQKSKKFKNSQHEKHNNKPIGDSQIEPPVYDDDDAHCPPFGRNKD